ncbi:MAG TPA: hypothetical protein ENJ12_07680 [Thiolapillus brandeum]|uniref:Uncharacterized protein n=1 Tax=Thiolapillus brandeum TaxID=1076588 RepID=A0A831RXU5_9GAMM|nr:hypothetical protein [Thiolapillus brandeum]
MPSIPLPKPVELQQMLAMMYGSDLKAEPGNPIPATPGNKSLVALYVDDDDVPVATCAVDYNFTAFAGASLTKIPLGTAKECAETGDFSEIMVGNVHEIMNICSRLLMNSDSPHLRLLTLYSSPEEMPEDVQELVQEPPATADFSISFANYGDGGISFQSLVA